MAQRGIQYRVGSVRNDSFQIRDINSYSIQVYKDKILGQKI